ARVRTGLALAHPGSAPRDPAGLDRFGGEVVGGAGGAGQQRRDPLRGDGSGEVVTLGPAAAEAAEKAELVGVLDSFGDGLHAEGVGEGDGGADDGAVLGVAAEPVDEGAVD